MPSVYTFSYSDNELLEELIKVLGTNGGSFREQWSIQAEAVVEPVGWEALWKLSKDFCQKLEVRFPCVAHVCVEGVDWEGLSACVCVREVQHERVRLPSRLPAVPLVELWPTKHQSEACVDAQSTAEFIHLLRFYRNNVWLPWDELEDRALLPATLGERVRLHAAARDGTLPARVARRVALLRNEAVDVYRKIRDAEEMIDPDVDDDDDSMLPERYVSRCAELHARLDYLLSQWTIYENPHTRAALLADEERRDKSADKDCVNILWKGGPLSALQEVCASVSGWVGARTVRVCWSAEEALLSEPRDLLVCQRLDMPDIPLADIAVRGIGGGPIAVVSGEVRSCLLTVTSDCALQGLALECGQTGAGVAVRGGRLRAEGCRVSDGAGAEGGDGAQGVVVMPGAALDLRDCTLSDLYTGLVVHSGATAELTNVVIERCGVGIQMYSGSRVVVRHSALRTCSEQCVRVELHTDSERGDTDNVEGLEIIECEIGENSPEKVCVVRQETLLA